MSVDQIKTAIEQLSFEERAELAAWLHGWKDDEWDEQMKRDVAAGKLDQVLREVDEDINARADLCTGSTRKRLRQGDYTRSRPALRFQRRQPLD